MNGIMLSENRLQVRLNQLGQLSTTEDKQTITTSVQSALWPLPSRKE